MHCDLTCSSKVHLKLTPDGRGFGVYATEAFTAGDELLREAPLLRVRDFNGDGISEWEQHAKYIRGAIACLPEAKQCLVLGFSNVFDHHEYPQEVGLLKTNCIPCGPNGHESCLYALTCRINHACKANARFVWREDLGKELVFATNVISEGKEITVSYSNPFTSRKSRREHLEQALKFTCDCNACTKGLSADSDKRLQEIGRLIDLVPRLAQTDPINGLSIAMCNSFRWTWIAQGNTI